MTWSITRSKVVGGNPIVKWHDQPLRALDDDTLYDAVISANALADDCVKESSEQGIGSAAAASAGQAAIIVAAVLSEMTRRGVDSVGDGASVGERLN